MSRLKVLLSKLGDTSEATPMKSMGVSYTIRKSGGGFVFKIPSHGDSGRVYDTEGAARIAATQVIKGMKGKKESHSNDNLVKTEKEEYCDCCDTQAKDCKCSPDCKGCSCKKEAPAA